MNVYSGGTHKSTYAIAVGSGFQLDPKYRSSWRELFYPKDYGTSWETWKNNLLTRSVAAGGLCHPQDAGKDGGQRWMWGGKWQLHIAGGSGEGTLDHNPAVVQHWNSDGKNGTQASRKTWYQAGPFELIPRDENSRRALAVRGSFKPEIGEDFRGPNEK